MSGSEAIMWWAERDPALRSDFANITVLDHVPDLDAARQRMRVAMEVMPRLRERVVDPPLGLALPAFEPDPDFDLDYHLRRIALPAPGTWRQLLDHTAAFSADPLDRSRPLWQFQILDGLEGGRAAMLQKIHHTVTDGEAGLRLSAAIIDPLDGGPWPEPTQAMPASEQSRRAAPVGAARVLAESVLETSAEVIDAARRATTSGIDAALHPQRWPELAGEAAELGRSLQRQLFVTDRSRSEVLANRSLGRRFDTIDVAFDPLHDASHRLGCSLNDVYVSVLAGALGRYLDEIGHPVDELRMAMPVSVRAETDSASANRFAPARVLVPTGPDDPAERAGAIRRRLSHVKHETALGAVDQVALFFAPLPPPVIAATMHELTSTVDFAASNLRGSPFPISLCGARVYGNFPFGPRTGSPINVTMLSYCDRLQIGLNLDPAAVTDPDRLVAITLEEFDRYAALA